MATKTDIELKIVDSVDTSHTEAEVLTDSAANPDAFYVGRGYLAHNGEKVIEGIDPNGSYPNMTVGNSQKAKKAEKATHADTATDLSGRVEATPEVFTYRPSAGDKSIKDDNAFIRRVKGNSVVFNQLSEDEWVLQQAAGTVNNREYTLTSMTGSFPGIWCNKGISTPIGHKVLVSVYTRQEGVYAQQLRVNFQGTNVNLQYNESVPDGLVYRGVIFEVAHTNTTNCTLFCMTNIPTLIQYKDPQIFDLTAMFGAGNEPTTVEEFRALYPDSYYPYNAGELRNLVCSGIKTVGFNLVDKNNFLTGVIGGSDTPSQNSNYRYIKVPVFPNTEYYLKDVLNMYYYYSYVLYDSNMNRIIASGKVVTGDKPYNVSFVITTPSNAAYMIINVHKNFVDTCCVNLHHTGYRDGEYEPYKEVTHSLPLSKITNGEPLRKAGNVYDEINETHYIKRVGTVDLGSLSWFASTVTPTDNVTNRFFYAQINGLQLGYGTIMISAPYDEIDVHPDSIRSKDKTIYCSENYVGGNSPTAVIIRDSSYNDTASFKSAMSGVMLNYELAEPIVTPIETPIDFNYYVEDFGTEEALLAEDSAPFSADIVYQFNAVDNIRQNRISIQKLNDIFSGSKGEYVRADGSWGYIADLKGNFFVKPTLKRIRTGISSLSDTIQIIHPYLTEHVGDAKIVLMAVKRRGGSYYDTATNAKGRRKKRKAWGELHYAAMPNTEINHNTIEMSNGASFEAWQSVILTACGRIPEGLENAREPYNVNVASEDLAEFFATNGAIFVGKTPVIRLGVALRIPNPNFIDYGNGNKMWDYNDVTGKWEYKYLYSDVAEVVVKSQMLRTGGYVLGLELV